MSLKNIDALKPTAVLISEVLSNTHGKADDYSIVPRELLEQNQRTQRIFNIAMSCIASISLLVGGIGIMNIMLANILERTREIGVRRSLGARRRDIWQQFLVEALTISFLGADRRGLRLRRLAWGRHLRRMEHARHLEFDSDVVRRLGGRGIDLRTVPGGARLTPRPGRGVAA